MSTIKDFHDHATIARSGKIGHFADKRDFFQEINYISKIWGVPFHKINILEDTADGELWIYIDNYWQGDLDSWFYECMEHNASKEVFDNQSWEIKDDK